MCALIREKFFFQQDDTNDHWFWPMVNDFDDLGTEVANIENDIASEKRP